MSESTSPDTKKNIEVVAEYAVSKKYPSRNTVELLYTVSVVFLVHLSLHVQMNFQYISVVSVFSYSSFRTCFVFSFTILN